MPIVVDASVLVEVVARTERASRLESAVAGSDLLAPDLVDAEVLSVIRRWLRHGHIDLREADRAVTNLRRAPVHRMTTTPLIGAMWTARANLTPYDAAYAALARRVRCPLLTLDAAMARAPGLDVELLPLP